jgi:hypothetical protein
MYLYVRTTMAGTTVIQYIGQQNASLGGTNVAFLGFLICVHYWPLRAIRLVIKSLYSYRLQICEDTSGLKGFFMYHLATRSLQ